MSNTQAEPLVSVLHRDQDGTFFLKYEGDEQIYDVAMRNSPLSKAIDAYVAALIQSQAAEIERLRAAMLAWKAEAEFQYGQLRLQRSPSETDYPVEGALDAYARGKHPAIAALTTTTKE